VDRNESETTEQVSIIESVNDSPVLDPVGNSFVLWWSLLPSHPYADSRFRE
jgi:hypothetical protein